MSYYKIGLLKTAWRKGYRVFFAQFYLIVRDFGSRVNHERVYKIDSHEVHESPGVNVEGFSLHIYDSWEAIPSEYQATLEDKNTGIWWNTQEWLSKGWRLWLGTIDNDPAIVAYTFLGNKIDTFYFPMTANCLYVYYVFTLPHYRGRGLMPAMLTCIIHKTFDEELERIFIIVDESNTSSRNCIEKVGFRHIGNGITKKRTGQRIWLPNSIPSKHKTTDKCCL